MRCKAMFILVTSLALTQVSETKNKATTPDNPASPKFKKAKIIGQDTDTTTTIRITGIVLIKKEDDPSSTLETLQLIVTEVCKVSGGGAFIVRTDKKKLQQEASKLMTSISPGLPIIDTLLIQKIPCNSPIVADFTLYIAARTTGQIMYSDYKGTHFKQEGCWYSGMARVVYTSTPASTNYEKFYKILDAFVPLANKLQCDAIWIRAGSNSCSSENELGVAWGGDKGWCQVVSTEDIQFPKPTKVSTIQK